LSIPLFDVTADYYKLEPEIDAALKQVLLDGQFILGHQVTAFEQELAEYLGVKHAIGVASGTDALVIALRGLGIQAGDQVIVPAFTFFATAEAVLMVGAEPVFVDVDPQTYCLNPDLLAASIPPRTRAIIPVHLYGHPANMAAIHSIAAEFGLKVIEDNAQAFGAEFNGVKTGALGDAGCLSFFPTKNLGAFGDGGMVVTNDDELAGRARMLRTHGWRTKYEPELVGYNSRLDELQAAILRVKLRHVETWNRQRRAVASCYNDALGDLHLALPFEAPYARHVYHLYMVGTQNREWVRQRLQVRGIATGIYYPKPLHLLQPCLQFGFGAGSFPVAEQLSRELLALPLYPDLGPEQVRHIAAVLADALAA